MISRPHLLSLIAIFCSLNLFVSPSYGEGTWETTLHARDFDGNTDTIEGYYDEVLDITWLADAAAGAGTIYDDGFFPDDLGIMADIGGNRDDVGQIGKIRRTTDLFEVVLVLEEVGYRDQVLWFGFVEEVDHRSVDDPMFRPIKIIGGQDLYGFQGGSLVEKNGTQNALLRLNVLGR